MIIAESFLHRFDDEIRFGSCVGTIAIAAIFILSWLVSFFLSTKSRPTSKLTTAFPFKIFFFCCFYLLVLSAASACFAFLHQSRSVLCLAEELVLAAAWLVASLALVASRKRGEEKIPAALRVWWIASFCAGLPEFVLCVDDLLASKFKHKSSNAYSSLAWIPASLVLLVASVRGRTGIKVMSGSLGEPLLEEEDTQVADKGEDNVTPYTRAGNLSLLFISWVNPVLALGGKRTLEPEDLPQVAQEHRASTAYEFFQDKWERSKQDSEKSSSRPPSVTRTLVACYWKEAVAVGFLVVVNSLASYVGPYLIDDFVSYLSGVYRFPHEGLILVTVFLVTKFLENFSQRHWFLKIQFLAIKARATLTSCVYRKGLRLSNLSRQKYTSGEIVNHMAVDIQRVLDFSWYLHDIWILPLQVALALLILYQKVGVAAIATLVATLASVAVNTPFSSLQDKYQDKIMEAKDARMRATSECLKSMRILKAQAWEKAYLQKLEALRGVEYGWLKKSFLTQAAIIFLFWTSPMIIGVVTFGTCVVLKIPLTTGKVLSTLATFRVLQEALITLPDCISALSQTRVSLDRLSKFLHEPELQADAVSRTNDQDPTVILVEAADFSWDESPEKLSLSRVNLEVKTGMTVAVCGKVGSGKSSLLSCLLGEIPRLSGKVQVTGRTSYVGQTAWIQSGKIEDNVLFGSLMDRSKYDRVLEMCQLKRDLEVLPFGDQTEIGERGINLSGGQKQRIQLARALYQDADIYLLDDPFSAVDVETGTQIFKECVLNALASKTVILVTHQVEFLPVADLILVLNDGRITQSGTYTQLLQAKTDFSVLVGAHNKAMEVMNQADKTLDSVDNTVEGILDNEEKKEVQKSDEHEAQAKAGKAEQLVQEEEREKGSVGLQVYWNYCTAVYKGGLIPCILATQLLFLLFQIASNWWMARETPATAVAPEFDPARLIIGYGGFSFGASLFVLLRVLLLNVIGLATAQKFFFDMLHCIFHSPMSFFDSTPTGRILSRASTDQSALDLNVPYRLGGVAFSGLQLLGIVGVMSQAVSQVLIVFAPVFVFCILLQRYYISSGRELSRLQGIQKAPIIHHFAESIAGAPTVRGFGQEERFMHRNMFLIDTSARAHFYSAATMEWVSLRLELLTNVVFGFCLLLLVFLPPGTIPPSLAGLAVTYGLNLNGYQSLFVWNLCNVERMIVSVERIQQYSRIPSEAPWEIEESKPPESWPATGNVELVDLKVRYNSNSPLVLNGISCVFPGGKRIGVVGRTGSGKSTLIQAIFRLVEPSGGKIVIDSVDITKIGLHDLRSKLSIIPQDPTLFEGTIRYNLDPLGQFSDPEIWEALDKCQLGDFVRCKEEKLDSLVSENGENWSVGQRQLFCLGRVMLKQARVLVLDEATASVDSATDGVIQSTIATKFQGCTVITIAHRLPTVVGSDYVLVLKDGRIAEYDEPGKLLESSSHFFKLVAEYSKRSFGSSA
ncbi:putative ABC transporter C family member 15 [Selaginella moellendorffii]|nr:putative ABC transporter C family member 15 [Selaginella moellendorffii]|eukprot:XP_002967127.2 putative ABC transporter C family member 15 [Selaginella moellendorffii]